MEGLGPQLGSRASSAAGYNPQQGYMSQGPWEQYPTRERLGSRNSLKFLGSKPSIVATPGETPTRSQSAMSNSSTPLLLPHRRGSGDRSGLGSRATIRTNLSPPDTAWGQTRGVDGGYLPPLAGHMTRVRPYSFPLRGLRRRVGGAGEKAMRHVPGFLIPSFLIPSQLNLSV